MKLDEIDPADRPRLFCYLTNRYIAAESRMPEPDHDGRSLEAGTVEVVELTPEAIAAMEAVKAADADREAWRAGTVRDELYRRWSEIDAGRLIRLPDSAVELAFVQQLERTGMRTPFLWIARGGERDRGVVLSISDQLRPMLQPPAVDDELWAAVIQLSMPLLSAGVYDADAFFAAGGDLEIVLRVGEVQSTWDPALRYPTL